MELNHCFDLQDVHVEAESLDSFSYVGVDVDKECEINISVCQRLQNLTLVELKGAAVTDEWVNTNISAFSFLHVLVLKGCMFLENIELKNEKLETLVLEYCHNLKKADIDATNLLPFSYCWSLNLALLIISAKFDEKINLVKGMSDYWLGKLMNFLPSFNPGKSLALRCSSAKDLIFPSEEFLDKLHPLPDARHLRVELKKMPKAPTLVDLVENLLWFVPYPVVVTIVSATKKYSLKSLAVSSDNLESFTYDKSENATCRIDISECNIRRKSMDVGGAIIVGTQMEKLSEDQILAFLPTIDAIRYGILSKPLRSSWLSFPVLDLDFTPFASRKSQIAEEEVDDFEAVVNRLLEFALEKSVKELDLHICCKRFLEHNPFLLWVLSLKSITILKLEGFGYELLELNLTSPLLEYRSVYTCNTLKTIRVSSERLKNIELNHCFDLQGVHVEAESLESFSYIGVDVDEECEIEVSVCELLQNLTLVSARLSKKFFEQFTGLLLLKFLCLSSCFLPENEHL
ncbi:hypothetical protein L6164_012476 [Bauhinia variegata]|uniref:Uncharacterized protein n=1 Tax=Bauhinia variegata TaxID=167791 RepID=A0ACB9P969_BAUVA|nr:hypothetical protein L6164_012476 [Bauhinia variegata]